MTTTNCSSVGYLISARKNCLVSLILKLSIDLILAFHRKLFGSTDLSGLISSAFKDITKIPSNSQLFDFIGYRKYLMILQLCSYGFTWDSKRWLLYLLAPSSLLPPSLRLAGTVKLQIVETMIEPLSYSHNTTSDLRVTTPVTTISSVFKENSSAIFEENISVIFKHIPETKNPIVRNWWFSGL